MERLIKTLLAVDFAALFVTAMGIDSGSVAVIWAAALELLTIACLICWGAVRGI